MLWHLLPHSPPCSPASASHWLLWEQQPEGKDEGKQTWTRNSNSFTVNLWCFGGLLYDLPPLLLHNRLRESFFNEVSFRMQRVVLFFFFHSLCVLFSIFFYFPENSRNSRKQQFKNFFNLYFQFHLVLLLMSALINKHIFQIFLLVRCCVTCPLSPTNYNTKKIDFISFLQNVKSSSEIFMCILHFP